MFRPEPCRRTWRIVNCDPDRNIVGGLGLAAKDMMALLSGSRETQTALSWPVTQVFSMEKYRVIGLVVKLTICPYAAGPDVDVQTIGVQIQPGDFGDVTLLRLIGGPIGIQELVVENAVVDEKVVSGIDCRVWTSRRPMF